MLVELDDTFEPTLDDELTARFQPERLSQLTNDYLENSPFGNIKEKLDGKEYVIGLVAADDPTYADLGKALETTGFARAFNRSLAEVYTEYSPKDPSSTFIVSFDVRDPGNPRPAGAMRIIYGQSDLDLKSIKDLVADDYETNPWRAELQDMLFEAGEAYDAQTAWDRLCAKAGVSIKGSETHDVATLAVDPEYANKNGALDAQSMLLYHSCLRFALGSGMKNLISIQDIKPLENLQQFGEPFTTFTDVQPHPYGGPFDTLPAFSVLGEGMQRIRACALGPAIGEVFIDGKYLDNTVLLQDLNPEQYSNKAIAHLLPPAAEIAAKVA